MATERRDTPNGLVAWVRTQYGPGKRYKSARSLSIAARRNPNTVMTIEERGRASAEVLVALARATDTSPLELFVMSGWIDSEEIRFDLSPDEERLVKSYRQTRESLRPFLHKMMEEAAPYG